MRHDMRDEDATTEQWRSMLTGEDPSLVKIRRRWRRLPAAPRCKVCASPFHGVGGAFARLVWHGPVPNNPMLCKACFGKMAGHPGGAELPISVVFADVRGSTALAERTSALLPVSQPPGSPGGVAIRAARRSRSTVAIASGRPAAVVRWTVAR
jgi:adenylate cyclase